MLNHETHEIHKTELVIFVCFVVRIRAFARG